MEIERRHSWYGAALVSTALHLVGITTATSPAARHGIGSAVQYVRNGIHMINASVSERAQVRANELLTRYNGVNAPRLLLEDVRSNRVTRGEFVLTARALGITNLETRRTKLAEGLNAYNLVVNHARGLIHEGRSLRESVVTALDEYRYYRFNPSSLEYAITKEGNCVATSEFLSSLMLDLKPYARERNSIDIIFYTNRQTAILRNEHEEIDMQSGEAPFAIEGRIAGTRIRAQDYEMLYAAEHGLPHQLPDGVRIERGDGIFAHVMATVEYPDPGIIRARHSVPLSHEMETENSEFSDQYSIMRNSIRRILEEELLRRAIALNPNYLRANDQTRYFSPKNGVPGKPVNIDFVDQSSAERNRIILAKEREILSIETYLNSAIGYYNRRRNHMHNLERSIALGQIVGLAETLKARVLDLPQENHVRENYDQHQVDTLVNSKRREALGVHAEAFSEHESGNYYDDLFSLVFLGQDRVAPLLTNSNLDFYEERQLAYQLVYMLLVLPQLEPSILKELNYVNIIDNPVTRVQSFFGSTWAQYIDNQPLAFATHHMPHFSPHELQQLAPFVYMHDDHETRWQGYSRQQIEALDLSDEVRDHLLNSISPSVDVARILVERFNLRENTTPFAVALVNVVDRANQNQ
jgi:hypothetical protein